MAEAESKALYLPKSAPKAVEGGHLSGRSKLSSFEDYWRASKAWQSRGLTLASARALANAGILTDEDLQSANSLELAMIPRIGAKSLALLYELKGEKVPDVARALRQGQVPPQHPEPRHRWAGSHERRQVRK